MNCPSIQDGCPNSDWCRANVVCHYTGKPLRGSDARPEPAVAPLPNDSAARKGVPLATGLLDYFPDALADVARLSALANDKHNPGEPLHWSRGKSNDHADCLARHFLQRGTFDTSYPAKLLHDTAIAWRALASLQLAIEALRERGVQYP